MNFGYPGENIHLENHGVSEESFWPSFTDIMMVIVMVFLLVTVAVILNNWSLIADLKNSISAQQMASSLAENRQEKNTTLESKLTFLEKQLVTLNSKYEGEKKTLLDTKQQLSEKETSLLILENKLDELSLKLENKEILLVDTKKALSKSNIINKEKVAAIASLQTDIENVSNEKSTLEALTVKQEQQIKEALEIKQSLQQNLEEGNAKIAVLEKEKQNQEITITQLKSNVSELGLDKQNKKSKIVQLQENITTLEKQKQNQAVTITQLKNNVSELGVDKQNKESKIVQLQENITTLEKQKQNQVITITQLEDNVSELGLDKQNKESKIVELQENMTTLEKEKQEQDTAITKLEGSVTNLNKERDELVILTKSQEKEISDSANTQQQQEKELELRQSTIVALQDKQKVKANEATQLQVRLDETLKEKEDLAIVNNTQKETITREVIVSKGLQKELDNQTLMLVALQEEDKQKSDDINRLTESSKKGNLTLANLQDNRNKMEQDLASLQAEYDKAKDDLKNEVLVTKEALTNLQVIKEEQLEKSKKLSSATQALQDAESDKQRIIVAMNDRIIESDNKRNQLEESLIDFKEKLTKSDEQVNQLKAQGNSQLVSLQGEYNTLDAKYQKLLRPARSSKGKYIVSVSYRKRGKSQQVRIKESPNGSYKSVGKAELHKLLSSLKKKYKDDLYLKIIIPAKSGLSYNEAWKFTNELQKKYDYYQ